MVQSDGNRNGLCRLYAQDEVPDLLAINMVLRIDHAGITPEEVVLLLIRTLLNITTIR